MNRVDPRVLFLFSIATVLQAGGCALCRPTLHAKSVERVPRPNRVVESETLWADAKPLRVRLRSAIQVGPDRLVELRAVHDGHRIGLLALWPDATESEQRRIWVWDPSAKRYYLRQTPTDVFAVKFCIEGLPRACMLTGDEGVYDVWEWRAGWTHVTGFAEDRKLVLSKTPPVEGTSTRFIGSRSKQLIHLSWEEDEGAPPYELIDRPRRYRRDWVYAVKSASPSGSAGDLLAEAVHQNNVWMLEIVRQLDTGHDDDYPIRGGGPHPFAVALTDGTEGEEHYASELIHLYLD